MIDDLFGWFVAGARGTSLHEYIMLLALATGVTALLAYHAFRSLRWWRMIEDVPTSKARSAHQGYVELVGSAELMDGPPIYTPMTRRDCVWWSLHTERASGDDWRTVSREQSDELFYLRDDTGHCVVDPEGAKVTALHKRVSRGGSGRKMLSIASGADYRYTERFIAVHDQLYIIGFFRTFTSTDHWDHEQELIEKLREWKRDQDSLLRRFDSDKDGKIDDKEWRTARRAARAEVDAEHRDASVQPGVNVIGAPQDTRPFLIAAEHEAHYTRRLRRLGIASAIGAIFAGAVAISLVGARL